MIKLRSASPQDGPLGPNTGAGEQAKVEEVLAATAPLPAEAVAAVEHARERERRQAHPHPPHNRAPPGARQLHASPMPCRAAQLPCVPGSHAVLPQTRLASTGQACIKCPLSCKVACK